MYYSILVSIPCFQNDPREMLQLSRYACHNISISFAVVNKVGRSTFSPSANLTVSGGTCAQSEFGKWTMAPWVHTVKSVVNSLVFVFPMQIPVAFQTRLGTLPCLMLKTLVLGSSLILCSTYPGCHHSVRNLMIASWGSSALCEWGCTVY